MKIELFDSKTKFYETEARRVDLFQAGRYVVKRLTVLKNMKVDHEYFDVFSDAEYMPEIEYADFYSMDGPQFMIQTTAYGAMSADEIEKIIAGYQHAVEVVKALTDQFC